MEHQLGSRSFLSQQPRRVDCFGDDVFINNNVKEPEVVEFLRSLTSGQRQNIRKLNMGNRTLTPAILKELSLMIKWNTTLQEFGIQYCYFEEDSSVELLADGLSHNVGLQTMTIGVDFLQKDQAASLCKGISTNTFLKKIHLTSSSAPNADVFETVLQHCFSDVNAMEQLWISAGFLSSENISALASLLQTTRKMKCLHLRGCTLLKPSSDLLLSAISSNMFLKKLDLSCTNMDCDALKLLTGELSAGMPALEELSMAENKIGKDGCEALSMWLKHHKSLRVLNISENHVGDSGIYILIPALQSHPTLSGLHLEGCKMSKSGVVALMDALSVNCQLCTLSLSGNRVQHEGAMAIAEFLQNNDTLTQLDLMLCSIPLDGILCIIDSIGTNQALVKIDLSCNEKDIIQKEHMDRIVKSVLSSHLKNMYINCHSPECASELGKALRTPIEERFVPLKSATKSASKR